MKFELFRTLYSEALEEGQTPEYYIAERGWQEWMDGYTVEEVAQILKDIYRLANSPLKDTRDKTRAAFSRYFGIPLRTLEDWDAGRRQPPIYVKLLIDYAQFCMY